MFKCPEIRDLFDPALYSRNPHNIVGLPIAASAKDIRRRKEDVTADAFATGSAVCNTALLPKRLTVGAAETEAAFEVLKDPYSRAFYSLFWFWPMGEIADRNDRAVSLIVSSKLEDRECALADWQERCKYGQSKDRVIACHNLAVYYHLMALLSEDDYLNGGCVKCEDCERYWGEAIRYWDGIADDDEFWDVFVDCVRSLDDPRMTSGFVRRFRHDLPFGIDQINATLLNEYVRRLDAENVARQVRYMNQSQQGLDDVESSLGPIVGAVEKMQANFSADIDSKLGEDPHRGLALAERVLEFGNGMKSVARALSSGASINEARVADDMALLALHCQVTYANATKDWNGCLSVLKRTLALAVGDSARERIEKNLEVLTENLKATECDICHRQLEHPEAAVRHLKFCGEFSGTPAFESLVKELEEEARKSCLHELSYAENPFWRMEGRANGFSMAEDYYLRKLTTHPDFGKIGYKIREVHVRVCDECYGSGPTGYWVSELPPSKEGWILGAEPSSSDISEAVEKIIRRVVPHWKGWDDYKRRCKQAKKEYDKRHMVFGMREEFAHNLARSTGCMLPFTAILAVTLLGIGLIVWA